MISLHYAMIKGEGHQADYDRLFEHVFKDIGLNVCPSPIGWREIFSSAPLFFSWLDCGPVFLLKALGTGFLRSFMGLKTVGILFRPKDCFNENKPQNTLKRLALSVLRTRPEMHILSLIPYEAYPNAAKVSSTWIYDPQLWDLEYIVPNVDDWPKSFETDIFVAANGRKIVATIGRQDESKGFFAFADLWRHNSAVREKFLFVVAGKISPAIYDQAKAFETSGGFLLNRRIDNDELFRLYALTDVVWSCYAPSYDQSSGIFGRAVQFGKPAIVRAKSFIETLGIELGHPTLGIPYDDIETSGKKLIAWQALPTEKSVCEERVKRMRAHSMAILKEALCS